MFLTLNKGENARFLQLYLGTNSWESGGRFSYAILNAGELISALDSAKRTELKPLLSSDDVPALPVLAYNQMSGNEWELKRLILSRQGFEVRDECGIVSTEEGKFQLNNTTGSYYRPDYLETQEEYLTAAFWTGLDEILSTEVSGTVLGFLEYYGGYYLAAGESGGIVLYSLGETLVFSGGMPLSEFCKNAWEFYCYVENAPETIYGGDGITTHTLP